MHILVCLVKLCGQRNGDTRSTRIRPRDGRQHVAALLRGSVRQSFQKALEYMSYCFWGYLLSSSHPYGSCSSSHTYGYLRHWNE